MAFELILIYCIIFLYGIVIGSFLNVCIYRIPKGESLVTRRSHCMQCEYQLKWYDLIPVFSYLALRGRCRKCKDKIAIQYPLVEAINGAVYILIFLVEGFSITAVLYCLMSSALLVLGVIDARTMEIPLGINIFIFILGLIQLAVDHDRWLLYVIGFFLVSGLLEILWLVSQGRAIGGGDVKLMAAAGLLLGWQRILLAFVLGCILGSVIHLARMRLSKAEHMLALGPYLAAGIFLAALWGDTWISMYLNLIL